MFRTITVRNLIYHVCPLRENTLWRRNVQQLVRRWDVFNGRRIVAVAYDRDNQLWPLKEVVREFGGVDAEWLPLPNDRVLREVASFVPLLCAVQNTRRNEATFYAHTKGNSTAESHEGNQNVTGRIRGAKRWRNAMYHHLLDRADECMQKLREFPCVGTCQARWREGQRFMYPSRLFHGWWMFCGTFFWFRNDKVFGHPRWRAIPMDRYGAEAWLGDLFTADQAHSMFQPFMSTLFPGVNPYDPRHYGQEFDDE